jgi:hypothetical protein
VACVELFLKINTLWCMLEVISLLMQGDFSDFLAK